MKWKEVKRIALQRMFAINGDEIVQDEVTLPYLKAMPGAANEGLQLLCTAGKYITKSISIIQNGEEEGEGSVKRYNLGLLAKDFYMLQENQIFLEEATGYHKTTEYQLENGKILLLPFHKKGKWTVYYCAYPEMITADTKDEEELPLVPEAAVLLPLYIASQLYKDDDMGQAIQLRNEFELGRELLLRTNRTVSGEERFRSVSGWMSE